MYTAVKSVDVLYRTLTNVRWCCKSCHHITGKTACVLLPGDGVGPELTASVQAVFDAHNIQVDFLKLEVTKTNDSSLYEAVECINRHGLCLKSPFENIEPALTGEYQNYNVKLRILLDTFANVAHIKSLPNVPAKFKDIDLIIVREQTEAAYSNLEHEVVPGVVECLKVITWRKSWRIAKFAFDMAMKLGRKSVTCVHKANIMKMSDGLFLDCCRSASKLYPGIKFKSMIVDNTMMQLVSRPTQFDVILTPNLYGNIADNLCAGLLGGAGIVSGASYSNNCVVFEPAAHHTFSAAAGKNIANPTAMLLCASRMLWHVNMMADGTALRKAVKQVLSEGKIRTPDIGGKSSTTDYTKAVIDAMGSIKASSKDCK